MVFLDDGICGGWSCVDGGRWRWWMSGWWLVVVSGGGGW